MENFLDAFDEVHFNLEWRRMIGIAGSERFDMEKFQHLAKNTYLFLASFDNDVTVDSIVRLLYFVNKNKRRCCC